MIPMPIDLLDLGDLTKATPTDIDFNLSAYWAEQQRLVFEIASAKRWVEKFHLQRDKERVAQDVDKYTIALAESRAASAPYEAEFLRRGQWNRYFLVTNGNGHIHRGLNCVTCFPTTQYSWLIGLADCDERALVAEYGDRACTVCFPDAPTLPGWGDSAQDRRDRASKDEIEARKAARQVEKDAKAITAPDGSPLRVGYDLLRTKVAARNALSSAVQSYGWYGPTHPNDFVSQVRQLVAALKAAGVETDSVIERAAKKALKEGADYDIREVRAR